MLLTKIVQDDVLVEQATILTTQGRKNEFHLANFRIVIVVKDTEDDFIKRNEFEDGLMFTIPGKGVSPEPYDICEITNNATGKKTNVGLWLSAMQISDDVYSLNVNFHYSEVLDGKYS